jgi:hypothetical protein
MQSFQGTSWKSKRRTWPIWVVKSLVRNRICTWGKLNFVRWHNLQWSLVRKCQEGRRLRGIYRCKPCLVLLVSDSIRSFEHVDGKGVQAESRIPAGIYQKCRGHNHSHQKKAFLTTLEACVDTPRVISAVLDTSYFNTHALKSSLPIPAKKIHSYVLRGTPAKCTRIPYSYPLFGPHHFWHWGNISTYA